MAQGKVTVNALNLLQGSLPSVERHFLFVGAAPSAQGDVTAVDQTTDLDVVFGEADSVLKTNILAARLNASSDFGCTAVAMADSDWSAAIDVAIEAGISPEAIVVLEPMSTSTEVDALHTKAIELLNSYARRVFMIGTVATIDPLTETWSAYQTALQVINDGVAAARVGVVPQLHGNDAGVIAGRLCNSAASIADTPMRVATGAVIGLGAIPVDSDDIVLPAAVLKALDGFRFSVPQSYIDYPGTYWGDFNLLDIPGGDYQVVEHLRVVDKAARAVRLLAIGRVGNRQLNSTPISIANNKTFFARPLREMSSSTTFNGKHFPGEIKKPDDSAVQIIWVTNTHVQVWLKLTPYNCPKEITVNIALDLTGDNA
jgi:hypothetical protein